MNLLNKLKLFCLKNKSLIAILLFFTILAYGYFITNWAISIDSEYHTYAKDLMITWIQQGRFFIALINYITNFHIIPFWDDLMAVFLLLLTSLIWMVSLSTNKSNSPCISLIFGLVFVISPIYSFYLRFTTYNISIGIGILLISLASYYLLDYFNSINERKKSNLILSCVYLFSAICIYQMFVLYFFSALLLIILISALGHENYPKSFKSILVKFFIGMALLVTSLFLYKIISIIIYHFIPASDYTNGFIQWGKSDLNSIWSSLKLYFHDVFIGQRFNFFIIITLMCSVLYVIYLLFTNYKSIHLVILVLLFVISPFILSLVFGMGMPLRTMQAIPLVLAGMWVLFSYAFNQHKTNKVILLIVAICSLFNSQYINRLFYGDNMRLEYDKNFANQLYNYVIANTGDSIKSKPLVIVGKHSYSDRPFIFKLPNDTLGYSFFEWDGGNPSRIYVFMQWLGNDYIFPTQLEQEAAVQLSFDMLSYPAKSSLKETESFIVLKLSPSIIKVDQNPIHLDLSHYFQLSKNLVAWNIDSLVFKNNQLNYYGWAYIKQLDALKTIIFIKFSNTKNSYIFPVNLSDRTDVFDVYKDGRHLKHSGFDGILNNSMKHGNYKVYLILINENNYAEIDTNKNISLQ